MCSSSIVTMEKRERGDVFLFDCKLLFWGGRREHTERKELYMEGRRERDRKV